MTYQARYLTPSKMSRVLSWWWRGGGGRRLYISNCVKIRFPAVVPRDWLICSTGWCVQIVPFLCELFLFQTVIRFSAEAGLHKTSLLVHGFPLCPVFLYIESPTYRTHCRRLRNHLSFHKLRNLQLIANSLQLIETPGHA